MNELNCSPYRTKVRDIQYEPAHRLVAGFLLRGQRYRGALGALWLLSERCTSGGGVVVACPYFDGVDSIKEIHSGLTENNVVPFQNR